MDIDLESKIDDQNCPDCGCDHSITDDVHAEISCGQCGLVLENIIDPGPEWRIFNSEDMNKARGGTRQHPLSPDKGLSTEIGFDNKDAYGRPISNRMHKRLWRMKRWQRQSSLTKHRNLVKYFNELRSMSNLYHAPKSVLYDATDILRRANNDGLTYNRSYGACAAASLYIASQMNGIPVASYKDLAKSGRDTTRAFGSACKAFKKGLKITPLINPPSSYVPKICSSLDLSDIIQTKSCELLEEIERKQEIYQLPNTNRSLAAAIIYTTAIIYNERRRQKDVSKMSGITDVTLRKTYKNIVNKLNLDIYI